MYVVEHEMDKSESRKYVVMKLRIRTEESRTSFEWDKASRGAEAVQLGDVIS
jgi:hypothetical protein